MQEEQTKMGQTIYETICKMFDENNFPYERHDSDHVITCKARGEDLPMDFVFDVWDERQVVKLYSVLPFTVAKESLNDIIFAINFINGELLNGSFYFDIQNKTICYRLTTSYTDSILGTGLFHYMIMISLNTIEEYNDKLFMINKGMLTMEQFIDNEVNGQK